jgi:hypothetical protein
MSFRDRTDHSKAASEAPDPHLRRALDRLRGGPDAPVVLVEMLRERQQVTARTSLRTGRRLASISYEK